MFERLAKAEAGLEEANRRASAARENAADQRIQIEAMKSQLAELLQVETVRKD